MHRNIEPIGSMIFVATVSIKSKIFSPKIVIWLQGPIEREQTELKNSSGMSTISTDFHRFTLRCSQMNAIETSAIETVDVTAAIVNKRKNRVDQSCVAGIEAKTSGSVTKTRVAPRKLSPVSPNDVTAGKIINPIMTDTDKSSSDTVKAVFVSLVFLGK